MKAGADRGTPRVIAVVHARSAEHIVAALAGIAAQSTQPDVLVGVNCTRADTLVPGRDLNPPEPAPADDPFGETFAEMSTLTGGYPDEGDPSPDAPGSSPDGDETPTGAFDAVSMRDADGVRIVDQADTGAVSRDQLFADEGAGVGPAHERRALTVADVLGTQCDTVIDLPAGTGLNAAVAAALAWADEHPEDAQAGPVQEWIWVLGDHDRPSMKALAHLLDEVRMTTTVGIVGTKHRAGPTGRELVDVGITTTPMGRVLTFVDPGEPDQGQRDHLRDTLAVPLSGMLIRRDVWTELRGLDPVLEQANELDAAVDLCRRGWLAGHRVEVVPTAVLTGPDGPPLTASRRWRTYRRLIAAPLLAVPFVALGVLLGAILRVLAGVAAKEPVRALRHAGSSLRPLLRPDLVMGARWRAWRSHRVPRRRLRPLLATTRESVRWQRDRLQAARPRLISPAGADRSTSGWKLPLAMAVALAAVGGLALHRIARPGPLTSDWLPGVGTSSTALYSAWWSSWVPAGLGQAGPADPLLAVLATLGLPFGSPRTAVVVLLLAAPALAGVSAWWAAGGLTPRRLVRVVAGIAWAASPVLLLAVQQARLATVLAVIMLPLAVRALGQAAAAHSSRSAWAWSAAAGLFLVPATAGLPVLVVVLAGVLLLVAARARRLALTCALAPPLVFALPVLIAAWQYPAVLFAEPGSAVSEALVPGYAALFGWTVPPAATFASLAPWAHRLDGVLGPNVVDTTLDVLPFVLGSLPLLMAVLGLRVALRGTPRGAVCRLGWALTALGVLLVLGGQRMAVGWDPSGPVRGSTAAGVLLAVLGLLVAGVSGFSAPNEPRTGLLAALGRGGARIVYVLAVLPAVLALSVWAGAQALAPGAGDVRPGADPPIPAVVVDAAESADQTRIVTVRPLSPGDPSIAATATDATPDSTGQDPAGDTAASQGAGLAISVLREAGPDLEQEAVVARVRAGAEADPAEQALASAVADTVTGDGDARRRLAEFGVGAIVLLPGEDDEARTIARSLQAGLDSTPGLGPAGEVAGVRAWRVDSLSGGASAADRAAAVRLIPREVADSDPAWYALDSDGGAVDTRITVAAPGTIVLAERFDAGWTATFDGEPLTPTEVDGWGQGFDIPAGTGRLVVHHQDEQRSWIGWIQLVVLGLALLVALPVRAREEATRESTR
ncbi:MAG: hypothetical protein ACK5MT_15150 [Actinomycetales bacterium]